MNYVVHLGETIEVNSLLSGERRSKELKHEELWNVFCSLTPRVDFNQVEFRSQ